MRYSKISLWFLTLITATLVGSCIEKRTNTVSPRSAPVTAWTRLKTTNHLRVGYIVFPPTVVKDARTGALSGHFVTTINEIARQANWTVEFVATDWATFPAGLDTGRFDISIAPTFVTIPRAKAVSFSRPLFYAGNSAIVRRTEKRFHKIGDLDRPDVKIAVTQGEAGYEYAKQNLKHAQLLIHAGSDQSLTFMDVLTGRSDVALGDAYVTAQFAAAHPDSRDLFATSPYNLTPVSWAVASSEQRLLQFVNDSIEALESQGELAEYERAAGAHWLHDERALTTR
ncbi:MAG: amino acid ABC transporter substrate-binding protein [Acidobacteriaceae bacterium]|nr:amino acid ABC transporter substrate-binding protein [Acidobacteriaceae bacterium]